MAGFASSLSFPLKILHDARMTGVAAASQYSNLRSCSDFRTARARSEKIKFTVWAQSRQPVSRGQCGSVFIIDGAGLQHIKRDAGFILGVPDDQRGLNTGDVIR